MEFRSSGVTGVQTILPTPVNWRKENLQHYRLRSNLFALLAENSWTPALGQEHQVLDALLAENSCNSKKLSECETWIKSSKMGGEWLRQKTGRRFTSTKIGLIRCHLMYYCRRKPQQKGIGHTSITSAPVLPKKRPNQNTDLQPLTMKWRRKGLNS